MQTMNKDRVREKFDRRTIDDRRRPQILEPYVVVETRREKKERRSLFERRFDWARITQYISLNLFGKKL